MTRTRVPCNETVWSNRDEGGNIVPHYVRPCRNKAKVLARFPGTVLWVPLCGMHENTDRWANYIDVEWRSLDGNPLPNPWLDVDNNT